MDSADLRAWWAHRQGLMGELEDAGPNAVLENAGWARSIGGTHPYLAVFARSRGSRESFDRAMAERQVLELPAARGCTYVLPRSDFAVGLLVRAGEGEMAVARKLGVTEDEIDRLCSAIVTALKEGDKDPAELKKAVGDAARSLGEEGKKKGLGTTIPVALGRLQSKGLILRKPLTGRLDTQRYAYTYWIDSPLTGIETTVDEAMTELAKRYFKWIGPASLAHFSWFTGLSGTAVKAVLDRLSLVPFGGSDLLVLSEEAEEVKGYKAPKEPVNRLVGALDSLFLLQRDVKAHLAHEDYGRTGVSSKGPVELAAVPDLPNNAIVDRGRIVGLWEYDADRSEIVWTSFVGTSDDLKREVALTETYIREQLGDARSFSLDSVQSRKPLIDGLRARA